MASSGGHEPEPTLGGPEVDYITCKDVPEPEARRGREPHPEARDEIDAHQRQTGANYHEKEQNDEPEDEDNDGRDDELIESLVLEHLVEKQSILGRGTPLNRSNLQRGEASDYFGSQNQSIMERSRQTAPEKSPGGSGPLTEPHKNGQSLHREAEESPHREAEESPHREAAPGSPDGGLSPQAAGLDAETTLNRENFFAESRSQNELPSDESTPHPELATTPTRRPPALRNGSGKKTPRKPMAARLQSHTKAPTRSSSSINTTGTKPHLARSKSTDGIVRQARTAGGMRRSNRSHTKLLALQLHPLTKTTLNGSVRGFTQPLTRQISRESLKLKKTMLNGLAMGSGADPGHQLRMNKLSSSLKGMGGRGNRSSGLLKGMGLQALHTTGLKPSAKRGKAVMSLNEDDGEFEDEPEQPAEAPLPVERSDSSNSTSAAPETALKDMAAKDLDDLAELTRLNLAHLASMAFDESKNLYGGLFLLLQSTGMTRNVRGMDSGGELLPYAAPDAGPLSAKETTPTSTDTTATVTAPGLGSVAATPRSKQSLYVPNQSIFSNLQRNDLKFRQKSEQRARPDAEKRKRGPSIESRTQQRLWLQRENSLMDLSHQDKLGNFSNLLLNKLMFAHAYPETPGVEAPEPEPQASVTNFLYMLQNGLTLIQLRTEFERLNREYVNVRRHLNPVAKALARVKAHDIGHKSKHPPNANTFREFCPSWEKREPEINTALSRLWQEALVQSSSSLTQRRR